MRKIVKSAKNFIWFNRLKGKVKLGAAGWSSGKKTDIAQIANEVFFCKLNLQALNENVSLFIFCLFAVELRSRRTAVIRCTNIVSLSISQNWNLLGYLFSCVTIKCLACRQVCCENVDLTGQTSIEYRNDSRSRRKIPRTLGTKRV